MTPHFTLAELTNTDHREFDNTPNDEEKANLKRLAEFLELVKVVLIGKMGVPYPFSFITAGPVNKA